VRPMLLQDLSVSPRAIISQRLVRTVEGNRTPAFEVLLGTRNIQELIERGEVGEIKEAMEKSMSPGSQTFEQDLFRLVRTGRISVEEAIGNADSATNLALLLGNAGISTTTGPGHGKAGAAPAAPAAPGEPTSFSDFKISEDPSEPSLG
jgi:twitching motility protein PilU